MAATFMTSDPSLYSSMYQTSEVSYHDQAYAINGSIHPIGSSEDYLSSPGNMSEKPESMIKSSGNVANKVETNEQRCSRIGFRTKSEVEVLDDGYKWRKYGKKAVKNSPNPRNYYRCTTEDCKVKKRVERDQNDPSYVITTYEGVHNHFSPGTVLYENYNYFPYRGDPSSSCCVVSTSRSNQASYSL